MSERETMHGPLRLNRHHMRARAAALVALTSVGCATTPAPTGSLEGRTVVAVVGQRTRGSPLDAAKMEALERFIGTRLSQSADYTAVSQEQTDIVRKQKGVDYRQAEIGHIKESSLVELGEELAAAKILVVTADRLGHKLCTANLKLLDLRTRTTDSGIATPGPCDLDAIIRAADEALRELFPGIPELDGMAQVEPPGRSRTLRVVAGTSMGLGIASGIAAVVFARQASTKYDTAQDATEVSALTAAVDEGETHRTLAVATGGASAGLVVLGLVLYLVDKGRAAQTAVVYPTDGGAMVGLGLEF